MHSYLILQCFEFRHIFLNGTSLLELKQSINSVLIIISTKFLFYCLDEVLPCTQAMLQFVHLKPLFSIVIHMQGCCRGPHRFRYIHELEVILTLVLPDAWILAIEMGKFILGAKPLATDRSNVGACLDAKGF